MAQATATSTGGGQGLNTPQALFVHELSDIRSAESIILTMLEEAMAAVSNAQLKAGIKAHHEQTQGHLDAIKEKPAPEILDSMIASGAMKTEHYEIVAYEGLVEQAKALGQSEAAKLLQENLKQEKETLKKLEELEPKLQEKVEKLSA
jgi:ferritin-like metal-binding protein YciE